MSGEVIEVANMEDFKTKLLKNSQKIVMVEFTADWCQPSKTMEAIVDTLAKKYSDSITVLKIDVDKLFDLTTGISGVPTFRFYKEGEVFGDYRGARSVEEMDGLLAKHL